MLPNWLGALQEPSQLATHQPSSSALPEPSQLATYQLMSSALPEPSQLATRHQPSSSALLEPCLSVSYPTSAHIKCLIWAIWVSYPLALVPYLRMLRMMMPSTGGISISLPSTSTLIHLCRSLHERRFNIFLNPIVTYTPLLWNLHHQQQNHVTFLYMIILNCDL